MGWESQRQQEASVKELLKEQQKQIKDLKEALQRIADNYDNVEDLAGLIARETLDKHK